MATASVIKLKVRRGSDASRQLVILDQGEIGYTTDSKRLFVGDGSSPGGISTGSKFYATYTGIANATATSSDLLHTAQTGDIVYDATTNPTGFYILSGNNSSFNQLSAYTAFNVNQTIYFSTSSTFTNSLAISATVPVLYGDQTIFTMTGAASGSVFNSIQNITSSVSASTDLTLCNDLGTNYVDLGINSSKYNGNLYSPVFNIIGPNDSYLFAATANFGIGNTGNNGDIIFFTGGSLSGTNGSEAMRITNNSGIYAGNIGIDTSTPGAKLTVNGAISSNSNFSTSVPFVTSTGYVVSSSIASLILTGATTVTLPAPASYPGRWLTIKNAINAATIVSATSNVISITGFTGYSSPGTLILPQSGLAVVGKWVQLQSDGVNWVAMAAN